MRLSWAGVLLWCSATASALAQEASAQPPLSERTLADLRQNLAVLSYEIQSLKRELSTTSAPQPVPDGGLLDRVNAIEAALQELTNHSEILTRRIEGVVQQTTSQIQMLSQRIGGEEGDLQGTTSTAMANLPSEPASIDQGPSLAVGERSDFEMAQAAYDAGRGAETIELLDRFLSDYPNSPRSAEVKLLRGQAFDLLGDTKSAARSYLEAFNSAHSGPFADASLYYLGQSLLELGQTQAGCETLSQVSVRFPDAQFAQLAQQSFASAQCQ